MAESYGVHGRVIFEKAISHDQLIPTISGGIAGLCIIQNISKSYLYSLPNKLFEYIQAGLPVIASDLPEIKDIIRKYDVGIIVDPDSHISIAAGIQYIQKKGKEYFQNNIQLAKNNLNWENEAKKLVSIYSSL